MELYIYLSLGITLTLAVLFAILFFRKSTAFNKIETRFKDVIDVDTEKAKVQEEVDTLLSQQKELQESYRLKREIYDNLIKEISVLEEDLDFISYGIYKPHFDFDTAEKYKQKRSEIQSRQKDAIREKNAAVCLTEWTVSGSKVEGRKMTNRNLKLILRAFNGECDAAIMKVKWNNISKMEERIKKAFDALNKLGEPNHIEITRSYLQLKLDELHVAYEYQDKLYQEKEEQRQIREQMREEEKVQQEIERAKREAEQDEKKYQKAMEKAKEELSAAHGEKLEKLKAQMKQMEQKLKEAKENKQRALSRAQMTKSGHVYIISNIGSFGENVYKIGMTRRLEPTDRVRELGDASVPFAFDIHAMIYSENAPELENELHKNFDGKRLNLVNQRKEFFRVSLDEIVNYVSKGNDEVEFTKLAEAREYRESMSIRDSEKLKKEEEEVTATRFPSAI